MSAPLFCLFFEHRDVRGSLVPFCEKEESYEVCQKTVPYLNAGFSVYSLPTFPKTTLILLNLFPHLLRMENLKVLNLTRWLPQERGGNQASTEAAYTLTAEPGAAASLGLAHPCKHSTCLGTKTQAQTHVRMQVLLTQKDSRHSTTSLRPARGSSTRKQKFCSIASLVEARTEREWAGPEVDTGLAGSWASVTQRAFSPWKPQFDL